MQFGRRVSWLLALAAVLMVTSVAMWCPGGSEKPAPPVRVNTAEEALDQDAAAYVETFGGVTIEEARERLSQQTKVDPIVERIQADRGRYAGLWLEHKPEYRLVVRLKGTAPVPPDLLAAASGSPIPVKFEPGATATEDEVRAKIERFQPQFRAALPGLQGTSYDPATGAIVLIVVARGAEAARARTRSTELSARAGHPVDIEVIGTPLEDGSVRGGANLSDCTAGFAVRNGSGTRGVLTAGHCGDQQTYRGLDGTTAMLSTTQGEIRDGDQDVQWHATSSSVTVAGEFFVDANGTARAVSGSAKAKKGDFVCHRGKTTRIMSCGTVQDAKYRPTDGDPCLGPCSDKWVLVEGPNLACARGDSGGPWFIGSTAYGIYKAQSSNGAAKGQCVFAVFMPIDHLNGLGVTLLQ